jgi:hypothetical protein
MSNTTNRMEQGGGEWVVGGELRIATGGTITPNSGTQASAITNPTGGATTDAEARTAINSILAALRGVGIIAT